MGGAWPPTAGAAGKNVVLMLPECDFHQQKSMKTYTLGAVGAKICRETVKFNEKEWFCAAGELRSEDLARLRLPTLAEALDSAVGFRWILLDLRA